MIPTQTSEKRDYIEYMLKFAYIGYLKLKLMKPISSSRLFSVLNTEVRVVFMTFKVGMYFSLKVVTPLALKVDS